MIQGRIRCRSRAVRGVVDGCAGCSVRDPDGLRAVVSALARSKYGSSDNQFDILPASDTQHNGQSCESSQKRSRPYTFSDHTQLRETGCTILPVVSFN